MESNDSCIGHRATHDSVNDHDCKMLIFLSVDKTINLINDYVTLVLVICAIPSSRDDLENAMPQINRVNTAVHPCDFCFEIGDCCAISKLRKSPIRP